MAGWWDHVDRALQVQRDTFGEPVVVYFGGAAPEGAAVTGVFEAPPAHADLGLQRELSNQAPWLGLRVADLPGGAIPPLSGKVSVRGVDWEITDIDADGSGHVRCRLDRLGDWAPTPPPPLAPVPLPQVARPLILSLPAPG
jgi:hypothetical protein